MYNNIALLIGHLIGDYILQNDWMASNKSKHTLKGFTAIVIHCFLYSLSVATCVTAAGWRCGVADSGWLLSFLTAFSIAWVTHYPIDAWCWASKWIKLFGQTNLMDELYDFGSDAVCKEVCRYALRSPKAFFAAPVYIAVDNTMHLVLMWLAFSLA